MDSTSRFGFACRISVAMIALSGMLASGRAIGAELVDYCPEDTKQVYLIDIARFEKLPGAKVLIAEGTVFDFIKAQAFPKDSPAEAEWKKSPDHDVVEKFVRNTSKVMMCVMDGFLTFAFFCEGDYVESKIQKVFEEQASARGVKLNITPSKNYTAFEIGPRTYISIGGKVLVQIASEDKATLIRLLDQTEIKPTNVRSASIVKQLLRDPNVFAACSGEETKGLFGATAKSYDIFRGAIELRGKTSFFNFSQSHAEAKQADKTEAEFTEFRDAKVTVVTDLPIAAEMRAVTIDRDDNTVTLKGAIELSLLKQSLPGLIELQNKK